ncbi:hypothetical protein IHV84_18240 [Acidovorax sp. IB03]|uniref:Uncharacterized protein n=1 Tax=Acidovorax temperans TaxID=80878 RepID=A0A0D7K952_9BURK|nr:MULTISPECIES: hypothetical protein [Acidovorax]KJA10840.1 hypothetical protein RP29_09150 [Acidovorax temperans]MBJ2165867.1 hypothetical protein [Acidovorax sp. IB03]
MAPHSAPSLPDTPSAAPVAAPISTTLEAASPAPGTQIQPTEAVDPAAQRLRHLFRRLDAKGQTHVLKKALFEYRGIELP